MGESGRSRFHGVGAALTAAAALLLGGCHTGVQGHPIPPLETTSTPASTTPVPTTSSTPPSTTPPAPPSTPATPGAAIPLTPDANGSVFIETKSGRTRCQITTANVGCEAEFTGSPMRDGEHANGVNISSDGTVRWVLGNLGAIPTVTIDYLTYAAQGWTIVATTAGTRFTNDKTRHGMFVSIEKVDTF